MQNTTVHNNGLLHITMIFTPAISRIRDQNLAPYQIQFTFQIGKFLKKKVLVLQPDWKNEQLVACGIV